MSLLGNILENSLNGMDVEQDLDELFTLLRKLNQEAYSERGKRHVVTARGKLKYMFVILIQRAAYTVSAAGPSADSIRSCGWHTRPHPCCLSS